MPSHLYLDVTPKPRVEASIHPVQELTTVLVLVQSCVTKHPLHESLLC
ncbi:Uncharacterised protein [Vibrio cholerae]|nr:Uncharacterised protein [Vibrio cholerae]